MITLGTTLLTLAFITVSAKVDADHINDKEHIEDHKPRWILRAIVFSLVAMYNHLHGLASAFLFAALFDQVLNLMIGKKLFYLGNTATWDKFFNKRKKLYFLVKIICLISSVTLYLL